MDMVTDGASTVKELGYNSICAIGGSEPFHPNWLTLDTSCRMNNNILLLP